jgi:hypothetical protein
LHGTQALAAFSVFVQVVEGRGQVHGAQVYGGPRAAQPRMA